MARVWTLPTGLLALADVRYGRTEAAVEQLHHIALTTQHGMLGAFEELIPGRPMFHAVVVGGHLCAMRRRRLPRP